MPDGKEGNSKLGQHPGLVSPVRDAEQAQSWSADRSLRRKRRLQRPGFPKQPFVSETAILHSSRLPVNEQGTSSVLLEKGAQMRLLWCLALDGFGEDGLTTAPGTGNGT
jgi:hypothetical protein